MPTKHQVAERREQVAQYMRRSITSPKLIGKALQLDPETVRNDQKALRRMSRTWLTEMAVDGLAHDTQLAVEALRGMEMTLQQMLEDAKPKYNPDGTISDKGNPNLVLKITAELRELIDTRIETEANGPTLMALRSAGKKDDDG